MDRLTILRLHVFCKSATSHIMFFFRTLSPHVRMQAHTRIVYSHTRACASSQIWMHTSARTRARVRVRVHACACACAHMQWVWPYSGRISWILPRRTKAARAPDPEPPPRTLARTPSSSCLPARYPFLPTHACARMALSTTCGALHMARRALRQPIRDGRARAELSRTIVAC